MSRAKDRTDSEWSDRNISDALNSISTIEWLKKRFFKTTKIQYLNNPTELNQHKAIENVFKKLDEDNSNSLDIDEVNQMFINNNISITYDQLKVWFEKINHKFAWIYSFKYDFSTF